MNIIASKHPVKAPRNASVIERLLKVRNPWPVRRNPVYAIATVQRITRTGCMEDHLYRRTGNRADMRSGRKQLSEPQGSLAYLKDCLGESNISKR